MPRTLFIFSLILISLFVVATPAHAEAPPQFQFQPIVSVPLPTGGAVGAETSLTDYLNGIFVLTIAVATILGVVMITFDGIRYMTSDAIGTKKAAIEGLQGAAIGLVLLLLSYILLNVINPQILNIKSLNDNIRGLGGSSSSRATPPPGSTGATGATGALNPSALPSGTELRAYDGTLSAGCTLTCWLDNAFLTPTGGECTTGDAVQRCPASATPPTSPATPAGSPSAPATPTPGGAQPASPTTVQYGWRGDFLQPPNGTGARITRQAGPFSNSSQCDASLTTFMNQNPTLTITSNFPCNCGQPLSTQSGCSSIR
ncbi:hypothetical protein EPO14_04070 [Patescibacteria group bacterium]|nr:MAG: hypothetical protein EPO14_04070 [Patescibacteria group bacterium]